MAGASGYSDARTAAADDGRIPRLLALAIGAVYTLVGIAGFFLTGFDGWTEHTGESLLGFEVNPLHNVVHLAIGLAGLALSRTLAGARTFGWLLAVGYGAALVYGLFAAGNEDIDILAINAADNVLHALSTVAGLAIALWPVRTTARTTTARTR